MKRNPLLALAMLSASMLFSSCMVRRGTVVYTNSNGATAVVGYHYWYYPTSQVYYDYQRKVYYYPESGTWYSAAVLPPRFSLETTHVMVDVNSNKPYVDYEKHRVKYPPQRMMENKEMDHSPEMDHAKEMDHGKAMDKTPPKSTAKGIGRTKAKKNHGVKKEKAKPKSDSRSMKHKGKMDGKEDKGGGEGQDHGADKDKKDWH